MRLRFLLVPLLALFAVTVRGAETAPATLRAAYADTFLIGVALDTRTVTGANPRAAELVARQFSSLTAENDMKWSVIHPEPDRYRFRAATAYVEFARRHDMAVIGQALVWQSQVPSWVFLGDYGQPASRDLLARGLRKQDS